MMEVSTYFQGDGLNKQVFQLRAYQQIYKNMELREAKRAMMGVDV